MSTTENVAITGLGIKVPGISKTEELLTLQCPPRPEEFDPRQELGRRGLRYKDRATKLALCAVQNALAHAGMSTQNGSQATTGVVVSSNLGNIDSVCQAVQTLRRTSVTDLSPMSLPNLSSNNIASAIAIRFDCRGANLTMCNGATSGIEALYLAANVIRAQRARRMLVVGVEPRNEIVHRLMTASQQTDDTTSRPDVHLGDGAACVVLENVSDAKLRQANVYGLISGYAYAPPGRDPEASILQALESVPAHPHLWLVPGHYRLKERAFVDRLLCAWDDTRPDVLELCSVLGEMYGALGVFQCVAACLWLKRYASVNRVPNIVALATLGGLWSDGVASLCISRVGIGS